MKQHPKRHWNYRLMRLGIRGAAFYEIREVHYADGKPVSYSMMAASVGSETIKDISSILRMMKSCLAKPVLTEKDFKKRKR